jgi:hypothetical protein
MVPHSVLGYAVLGLAAVGYALALATVRRRSKPLGHLLFASFVLCWLVELAALVTGVIDNAGSRSAVALAPYDFFFGASLFTLTGALVVWRVFNPTVVWDESRWLSYHVATLGQLALTIVLVWIGRLALGGG